MVTSVEAFRDGLFGIFYIMTEQNGQQAKHTSFGSLRRFVLFLIDAGQVWNAVVIPEFGWKSGVLNFIRKLDLFALVFDLVMMQPIFLFLVMRSDFPGHFRFRQVFLVFHSF
jgi:hypothetical protein